MKHQVLQLRQKLFGDITIQAIRSNKGSKIQITSEWVQNVNELIMLIQTVVDQTSDEKQLKTLLEYIFDSYECIITILMNRLNTLDNNVKNIQNKLQTFPNDKGLINALNKQYSEQELLKQTAYISLVSIIERYSDILQVVYLFSTVLTRELNNEIFTILSIVQLHQFQNLLFTKMSSINTFLLMSVFYQLMHLLPIQNAEYESNDEKEILQQLQGVNIQNSYQEYLQKLDQITISHFEWIILFINRNVTYLQTKKTFQSLKKFSEQNITDYQSDKSYNELVFTINIINRLLTQQFFTNKKLSNLLQSDQLTKEQIYEQIMQYKLLLSQNASVYVCIIQDDNQIQYGEEDIHESNVNSLIWTQLKNLTLLYFNCQDVTIDDWKHLLENLCFKSVHVNYNQLIQKIFMHQSQISTNTKMYDYLLQNETLRCAVHIRRAGVYPLLFRALNYDGALTLKVIQRSVEQLDELQDVNSRVKIIYRLRVIIEANTQQRCLTNEVLLNAALKLCALMQVGAYELESAVFLCISVIINVLANTNRHRGFTITQLAAASASQEQILNSFCRLLSAGSRAANVAAAELLSFVHHREVFSPESIAAVLKAKNDENALQDLFKALVRKIQLFSNDMFVCHILLRDLLVFVGHRDGALETLQLLYNENYINSLQLAYTVRIIIREYEYFKLMRGHSSFDELPLLANPKKQFRIDSIKQIEDIISRDVNNNSIMVKLALEEIQTIIERLK